METKIVRVENDHKSINNANHLYGCFGWRAISVRLSQDKPFQAEPPSSQNTNEATAITQAIAYATITYQRDQKMQHYAQIVELEKQFELLERRVVYKIVHFITNTTNQPLGKREITKIREEQALLMQRSKALVQ